MRFVASSAEQAESTSSQKLAETHIAAARSNLGKNDFSGWSTEMRRALLTDSDTTIAAAMADYKTASSETRPFIGAFLQSRVVDIAQDDPDTAIAISRLVSGSASSAGIGFSRSQTVAAHG